MTKTFDKYGNQVLFVVYDMSRKGTCTGFFLKAVFQFERNAHEFLAKEKNENLFISAQSASLKFLKLAWD